MFPEHYWLTTITIYFQWSCTLRGVHSVSIFVLFPFRSSGYQLGCTIARVSAQWPMEHVINSLQNITTDWTPHSVYVHPPSSTPSQTLLAVCNSARATTSSPLRPNQYPIRRSRSRRDRREQTWLGLSNEGHTPIVTCNTRAGEGGYGTFVLTCRAL